MKHLIVSILIGQILASTNAAFAYGIPTHKRLSKEAVYLSVLTTDKRVLSHLGLKEPDNGQQKFLDYTEKNEGTITELVEAGADFEDGGLRFFNHFYDAVNDRPLVDPPWFGGYRSPDWALEDKGNISGQNDSYKDTRQYFFDALTLRSEADRKKKWGRTFQGLGQVIHHLQDMAQPQHVRTEAHPVGRSALYEHITDELINSYNEYSLDPVYLDYPPVYRSTETATFNTPRKLWVTREDGTRETGRGTGLGIAEYTVSNFISYRHNFELAPGTNPNLPPVKEAILPAQDYPAPNTNSPEAYIWPEDVTWVPALPMDRTPITGKVYYVSTPVTDKYLSAKSGANPRTSTFSIYTDDLRRYAKILDCYRNLQQGDPDIPCNSQGRFHQTYDSFAEAQKFLLPRAIGYSAGLINYFFRGQINMIPDLAHPDTYIVTNDGPDNMSGTFTLYYDDSNGDRYPVPGASWTLSIPHGAQVGGIPFTDPESLSPAAKTRGEYMLVFQGTMGQESGMAVAARIVYSHPAPFLLATTSGLYTSEQLDQNWIYLTSLDGIYAGLGFYTRTPDYGFSVNNDVLFLGGLSHVAKSTDGGHAYKRLLYYNVYTPGNITYLGGTELLGGYSYFSTDLGETWVPIPYTIDYSLLVLMNAIQYIGNGVTIGSSSYDFYRSVDKGTSWVRMPISVEGVTDARRWNVHQFGWNQIQGQGSVIFAVASINSAYPVFTGLWKSIDEGNTWQSVPQFRCSITSSSSFCGPWSIAVSPYGEALLVYKPSNTTGELYRSSDDGETWEQTSTPDGAAAAGVVYMKNHLP
jgi:hypothetical protein